MNTCQCDSTGNRPRARKLLISQKSTPQVLFVMTEYLLLFIIQFKMPCMRARRLPTTETRCLSYSSIPTTSVWQVWFSCACNEQMKFSFCFSAVSVNMLGIVSSHRMFQYKIFTWENVFPFRHVLFHDGPHAVLRAKLPAVCPYSQKIPAQERSRDGFLAGADAQLGSTGIFSCISDSVSKQRRLLKKVTIVFWSNVHCQSMFFVF